MNKENYNTGFLMHISCYKCKKLDQPNINFTTNIESTKLSIRLSCKHCNQTLLNSQYLSLLPPLTEV